MGFTQADPGLFKTWAGYYDARKHMIDFMNHVREPLLDALREARGPGLQPSDRSGLAAFAKPGKIVVVRTSLGKVSVRFRVPADGRTNRRVFGVGVNRVSWSKRPSLRRTPRSAPRSRGSLSSASRTGETRIRFFGVTCDSRTGLIRSDNLETRVVEFAHSSFEKLVASGFLDLPGVASALEPETGGVTDRPEVASVVRLR